ncbi:TetM/TetW/TetO/TetS family tetracycline resistance ribosomal protection protein [Pseudoflavonifractor sp. An187]|uniref:translation factor GTPase family protein n=1 Tax=Pseudoflavonifractor sp. An187 TaxID=1965578 RepID=UPI000B3ADC84|nr:TetM/TetW/TetO/TetS family tetracycline resistance ribosomal protection protein [Pseudoflavonifractor sp. An187]OUP45142.1 translation elongation factor G [Pseudoflavonifractor sp. An187]
MKRLTTGIMAHVDAGKTTLTEAMLYLTGNIRRLGRVDHGDAFLDTQELERERGITIYAKQAILRRGDLELTLVDTPGHVDFSAETERALQVLDCAILVVSAADGVQGHTETLWQLLEEAGVPVFLFVNKMDQPNEGKAAILKQLEGRLGHGFVDMADPEARGEGAALCSEALMERYLSGEEFTQEELAALVVQRQLFPVYFGSALQVEGVEELLDGIQAYTLEPEWPQDFGARVFKITRDERGERLTWLKVTGGQLRVREVLHGPDWEEKVNQIRLYSGAKFTAVDVAPAGTVCAVTGLTRTAAGEGLGAEENWTGPRLEPVLSYQVIPPEGVDASTLLERLRRLEEEDPQLQVEWEPHAEQVRVKLMGKVHREVLERELRRRFDLDVTFGPGSIVYLETLAKPVEGVGHFEPLRHYAEVHLLLEPLERGAGLQIDTVCSEDVLDGNWQRLILTHLVERQHVGVLTGSPITDLKLTLLTGKGHLKHTEGGDFRQATYRAIRQGLMMGETILLEPWYAFRLEVPGESVGRAMTDVQRMCGEFEGPQMRGETAVLTGSLPVSEVGDYWSQVAAYTQGRGRFSCRLDGYRPCHNTQQVVEERGYDPDRDVDNPSGSVFCDHGAGVHVPWNEVRSHMHVDSGWLPEEERARKAQPAPQFQRGYASQVALDKELEEIFARTYGAVKPRAFHSVKATTKPKERPWKGLKQRTGKDYLLVDGYNIIHAWEDLSALAREDLDGARAKLIDLLRNYQSWRGCQVIVVFDAYKVKGGKGAVEQLGDLYVVYTKEAETADMYIERTTYQLSRDNRVRVATSDGLEQMIILGHGAQRMSAAELKYETDQVMAQIRDTIG